MQPIIILLAEIFYLIFPTNVLKYFTKYFNRAMPILEIRKLLLILQRIYTHILNLDVQVLILLLVFTSSSLQARYCQTLSWVDLNVKHV